MAGKGGRIEGSGRKPKADEEKVNTLFTNALKTFYKVDTDEEAKAYSEEIRRLQVSGATAIRLLEQFWNRDLSGYDPDGPLPESEPDIENASLTAGRASARHFGDRLAKAKEWRKCF